MSGKATDHLANERTFLAWVRTALGLIGLGFVLARMGVFLRQPATAQVAAAATKGLHEGQEFVVSGVILLAIGIAFAAWSGWSYDRNRHSIDADRFEAARMSVGVLTAVVVLGGLGLVGLVLWKMLGMDHV